MARFPFSPVLALVLAAAVAVPAHARGGWVPFGDARWVKMSDAPGGRAIRTHSTDGTTVYGGAYAAGRLPASLDDLTTASFWFKADKTGPGGGSPRMVFFYDDGSVSFLYHGSLGVSGSWQLVDQATGLWEDPGCGAVPIYHDLDTARACHAGDTITDALIVNDSGWAFGNDLTIWVAQPKVNGR